MTECLGNNLVCSMSHSTGWPAGRMNTIHYIDPYHTRIGQKAIKKQKGITNTPLSNLIDYTLNHWRNPKQHPPPPPTHRHTLPPTPPLPLLKLDTPYHLPRRTPRLLLTGPKCVRQILWMRRSSWCRVWVQTPVSWGKAGYWNRPVPVSHSFPFHKRSPFRHCELGMCKTDPLPPGERKITANVSTIMVPHRLTQNKTLLHNCDFSNNNNNNNNRTQRRYSRFFTISSQCCKLFPTRTLKWPGRNRVQITWNTSSAYHVQVSCYVPLGTKGQLSY